MGDSRGCGPTPPRAWACAGTYDYRFDTLGSDAFLSKLETLLGRRVRPLPVGRQRKSQDNDARGREVKNNR